ncbi:hypothetical protein AMEX_G16909 [Astyanax mexicanus]|uniref:Centrosome-associated FAM110 C-terminal domain-containing protein n=1 Tax=Astyanax mexicanus TaxID=7994 RepID=A0A8T2LE26_ASTMX|nr:hypothetical protein AMEX_G16909 [Astyanax mexicanus]
MCSSDQSEETPTPSSPANNDEDVDESSPHEVNVVKRNSSKKRPDSLLLYRQKGELQRGATDGYGKKPNKRTLLLSRRDKTIPFSRQQLDESEYEASSGQRLANETNQGCEDVARKPATVVTNIQEDVARKKTTVVTNIQEDVARKPTTVVTTNREDVPRKPTTVVTNIPENISRKPTTVVTNIPEDVSRKPTTVVTNNREDVARKLTTAAASDREDAARKLTTAAASDREDAARKLTTVVTNNHMDVARKPAITVLTNIPEDVSRKPTTVVTNNREDVAAATTTNREDTAKKVTTVVRSNRVDATRKPIKVLKNNREDVAVARKPMTVVTNNREDVANRSDVDDVTSSSERRRNRVSRSHSDISSRYSRSFAADFDTFFTYCGLDDDVVESVGRENFCTCSESVEEVFTGSGKVRSVSMAISDDGFSQTGSVHSDGLLEDELPDKKSGQGTSVIERNARIIKWLYSCRNAAQSGKTLRDLV